MTMNGGKPVDARLRIITHKLRFVFIGLLAMVLLSLAAFLLLNWSLRDATGGFAHQSMAYSVSPDVGSRDLDKLDIKASGMRVEVGMASGINRLEVGLYGEGYVGQKPTIDINGHHVTINCDRMHKHSSESTDTENEMTSPLTMRVLIPEDSLRQVRVDASLGASTDIRHLRTDRLEVNNSHGHVRVCDVNANVLMLAARSSDVRAEDNRITHVTIAGDEQPMTLRNNHFKLMEVVSGSGDVFIYGPTVRGQNRVMTETGAITVVTKRLPWSLMIDAEARQNGDVHMNYHKHLWKNPDVIDADAHMWRGSVGNNPANSLELTTADGHITIEKRGRYTDIHDE